VRGSIHDCRCNAGHRKVQERGELLGGTEGGERGGVMEVWDARKEKSPLSRGRGGENFSSKKEEKKEVKQSVIWGVNSSCEVTLHEERQIVSR